MPTLKQKSHKLKAKSYRLLAAACTVGALVALSACGATSSAATAATGSASSGGTMVLYTAIGYAQPIVDAFQQKTGLKVQVVQDSTGPLLTKISAEKNNPQWTMFWAEGDTAFASLDQQGLLQPYQAKATMTDVGQTLVPSDHAWQPAGVTLVMAVLCNADKVPTQPQSWQDLTGPQYKGLIGMNDPSQSGPTYPFVAGMMNQLGGEDQGKAYFSSLKANGLHVFPTNGDTVHALETGQIGCGVIQSTAAIGEQLKQKGKMNLAISFPSKSTLLASAMTISKSAKGGALTTAQQLEDFALSPEGQKIAQSGKASDSLYWPVVQGISPAADVPAFPAQAQHIDPTVWGPKQGDIVNWFTQNIK